MSVCEREYARASLIRSGVYPLGISLSLSRSLARSRSLTLSHRVHPHSPHTFFFFTISQVEEAQEREGEVLGIEGDTKRHYAGGGGSVTPPPLEVYVTGSLLLCGDLMRLLEIESY